MTEGLGLVLDEFDEEFLAIVRDELAERIAHDMILDVIEHPERWMVWRPDQLILTNDERRKRGKRFPKWWRGFAGYEWWLRDGTLGLERIGR